MSKFKCQNLKCIEAEDYEAEDIRLILTITDGTKHEYRCNGDGSLELYDTDGLGQEIKLHCDLCGQEYEFDIASEYIPEKHVLPFKSRDLKELEIKKIIR